MYEMIKIMEEIIEEIIEEKGYESLHKNIIPLIADDRVRIDGVEICIYFLSGGMQERKALIVAMLEAGHRDIMEEAVIRLLSLLHLQSEEDLASLFEGREDLLSKHIRDSVHNFLPDTWIAKTKFKFYYNLGLWIVTAVIAILTCWLYVKSPGMVTGICAIGSLFLMIVCLLLTVGSYMFCQIAISSKDNYRK